MYKISFTESKMTDSYIMMLLGAGFLRSSSPEFSGQMYFYRSGNDVILHI